MSDDETDHISPSSKSGWSLSTPACARELPWYTNDSPRAISGEWKSSFRIGQRNSASHWRPAESCSPRRNQEDADEHARAARPHACQDRGHGIRTSQEGMTRFLVDNSWTLLPTGSVEDACERRAGAFGAPDRNLLSGTLPLREFLAQSSGTETGKCSGPPRTRQPARTGRPRLLRL